MDADVAVLVSVGFDHRDWLGETLELIGAENVVFGSDYPHIEGMAEPLTYVKELDGLPHEDVAKVMGGNLADVMKIPFAA